MARKYFRYNTDLNEQFGASIDADLYAALVEADAWESMNKTGENATVYDTFAELNTADASLSAELPSDINPRTINFNILGQSVSVILPCAIADSVDLGSAFLSVTELLVPATPGAYKGEQDSDLNS